jgi:hypothetical protein
MTPECPGPGCIIIDDGIWCRTHATHHDTNDVIYRECAKALREAYEDAARIAETYPLAIERRLLDEIAAAIRARSMEQVKQPSQKITPDEPDSSKDS